MEYSARTALSFSRDLETHAHQSETFFDVDLLRLIKRHFGFADLNFTVYHGATYVRSFSHNSSVPVELWQKIRSHYNGGAFQHDPLANYITSNLNYILQNDSLLPVRSSQLPEDIHQGHSKIFVFVDTYDTISIPVTPTYRFNLMQYETSPTISSDDVDVFLHLGLLLRSRYKSFQLDAQLKAVTMMQNQTLEEGGAGVAILDGDLRLVNCNNLFVRYFDELFHTANISKNLPRIVQSCLMEQDDLPPAIRRHVRVDAFDAPQQFYRVTLTPPHAPAELPRETQDSLPFHLLTPRELEVLDLFCRHGCTSPEIAEALYISAGTVKTHLKNIYGKLGVNNQRRLIHAYLNELHPSR